MSEENASIAILEDHLRIAKDDIVSRQRELDKCKARTTQAHEDEIRAAKRLATTKQEVADLEGALERLRD